MFPPDMVSFSIYLKFRFVQTFLPSLSIVKILKFSGRQDQKFSILQILY